MWNSERKLDNIANKTLREERPSILNTCKMQLLSPFCPLKDDKKNLFALGPILLYFVALFQVLHLLLHITASSDF